MREERSYSTSKSRGCGWEEQLHTRGQGRWLGGAASHPRSSGCMGTEGPRGAIPCWRSGGAVMRRYSSSRVRSCSCALLEQPWRDTPRPGKRNASKMVGVARGHQRADTLKPYSQKTSQTNHSRTTALSNSIKLSHAVGQPKMAGHGGEVRQNVVH